MGLEPRTPGLRVKHLTTEPRGTLKIVCKLISQQQVSDSSKVKDFANDDLEFDQRDRKLEKTEKRKNCLLQAISPSPTLFSKDLFGGHIKTRACLEKG